ncbi:MAG: hypothetical protein WCE21_00075 [Candidatus Babeliales bacterium]
MIHTFKKTFLLTFSLAIAFFSTFCIFGSDQGETQQLHQALTVSPQEAQVIFPNHPHVHLAQQDISRHILHKGEHAPSLQEANSRIILFVHGFNGRPPRQSTVEKHHCYMDNAYFIAPYMQYGKFIDDDATQILTQATAENSPTEMQKQLKEYKSHRSNLLSSTKAYSGKKDVLQLLLLLHKLVNTPNLFAGKIILKGMSMGGGTTINTLALLTGAPALKQCYQKELDALGITDNHLSAIRQKLASVVLVHPLLNFRTAIQTALGNLYILPQSVRKMAANHWIKRSNNHEEIRDSAINNIKIVASCNDYNHIPFVLVFSTPDEIVSNSFDAQFIETLKVGSKTYHVHTHNKGHNGFNKAVDAQQFIRRTLHSTGVFNDEAEPNFTRYLRNTQKFFAAKPLITVGALAACGVLTYQYRDSLAQLWQSYNERMKKQKEAARVS